MQQIEKLNLVMSYPVKWTVFAVMRDYVQNFYDAVGPDRFGKDFSYAYNEETKSLRMQTNRDFSMDWLTCIGASSKRSTPTPMQVGRFGEGFKIASLIAYRDYGWDITMESREWKMHVTEAADRIDGTEVKVLAYETEEREFLAGSVLTLKNVSRQDADLCEKAVEDYFYRENPNFLESIAETDFCAVYLPSKGSRFEERGALYAGGLNRIALGVPLIVCNHTYRPEKEGRERDHFYENDIKRCSKEVFDQISPKAAGRILRVLERVWSRSAKAGRWDYDWEETVSHLIRRVAEDSKEVERFRKEYGSRLVADFPDEEYGNRRKLALAWFGKSVEFGNRRIVFSDFETLSIDSLDSLCREHGGYEQLREANLKEQRYLDILERIAATVFKGYVCYNQFPHCRIITNRTVNAGSAFSVDMTGGEKNSFGLKVRQEIRTIQLRVELFAQDRFSEAVAVYMHELMHQFGGDGSEAFRKMITLMALQMLREAKQLEEYEKEWKAVEGDV